ncbi:MAG: ATP-binding SpoIIE family protein phosphatase [Betaproteobacteria bacterium]
MLTQKKSFLINKFNDIYLIISEIKASKFIDEASFEDQSLIGTIISELGFNIIKYATRGEIRVVKSTLNDLVEIDIWAEDQGPGIKDIYLAMKESFSTSTTLGLGLPGVRRMSDNFWIRSNPEQGTLVLARKKVRGNSLSQTTINQNQLQHFSTELQFKQTWDIGSFIRPMNGEINSGDFVVLQQFEDQLLALIIDVTGHGDKAHEIGKEILGLVYEENHIDLQELFLQIHQLLKGGVGAAAGGMLIDSQRNEFQYIGVGNTNISRLKGDPWNGVSKDGVLGHRFPNLFVEKGHLKSGEIYLLSTDGLPSRFPNNFISHNSHLTSSEIAINVMNNYSKVFDDSACIVLKWL